MAYHASVFLAHLGWASESSHSRRAAFTNLARMLQESSALGLTVVAWEIADDVATIRACDELGLDRYERSLELESAAAWRAALYPPRTTYRN